MPVRWRPAGGPVLVALVAVALGLPALAWPADTLDELILLVYPIRMLDGDLPYRDFFTIYGPAHWWLLEGSYALTSPLLLVARLVGLTVHVGLALGTYALARSAGRPTATVCGVLSALLMFRLGDAPYAWLTAAALCVWQVVLLIRESATARMTVVAGLCAGLALSVRPDVLPLVMLPAVCLLLKRARWRAWAAGLTIGLVPLLLGLALSAGPLVNDIFVGRAGKAAGQSRLPLMPSGQAAQELLFVLLLAVICLVAHAYLLRTRGAVALLLLALATLPQALQRLDLAHLTYSGLLFLPLLPVVLRQIGAHLSYRGQAPVVIGTTLVLLGLAGSSGYPLVEELVGRGPTTTVVTHDGRSLRLSSATAGSVREVLAAIDERSTPGETVFVFDKDLVRPALNDVRLYYLLPRLRQTAKHVEVTLGISNASGSGLVDDLLSADVVVLLDLPPGFRHQLYPYEKDGSQEATQALDRTFCQVAEVSYYEIYRRCGEAGR
ncbi:MAG: hypothetical protein M3P04_14295 [Actinomycetota bacterium]|nr:hypothetical protein [Actinomycetota bacterium]